MLELEYFHERHRDMLREAEKERLLRSLRTAPSERKRAAIAARVFLATGQVMVRVGSRLEQFGRPSGSYADEIG